MGGLRGRVAQLEETLDWLVESRVSRLIFKPAGKLDDPALTTYLDEIGIAHPDRNEATSSGLLFLPSVLKRREIAPRDVFVDFGSGKGLAVYVAARWYPFARVVGVEVSDEFNASTRAVLERDREKLSCPNVELVTTDAIHFPIPPDMTVAYLYNPFGGRTFTTVMDHIVQSLDLHPRRLKLIYANPVHESYIASLGRFELVRRRRARRLERRISVYESRPRHVTV